MVAPLLIVSSSGWACTNSTRREEVTRGIEPEQGNAEGTQVTMTPEGLSDTGTGPGGLLPAPDEAAPRPPGTAPGRGAIRQDRSVTTPTGPRRSGRRSGARRRGPPGRGPR